MVATERHHKSYLDGLHIQEKPRQSDIRAISCGSPVSDLNEHCPLRPENCCVSAPGLGQPGDLHCSRRRITHVYRRIRYETCIQPFTWACIDSPVLSGTAAILRLRPDIA